MRDVNGRIYTHYKSWEDYKNGMYKQQPESLGKIDLAVYNLSDTKQCKASMERVIKEWPISASVNLSIPGCQRPWLGRAACSIQYNISENITRIAWWKLSLEQQEIANEIADDIIAKWRLISHNIQRSLFNG